MTSADRKKIVEALKTNPNAAAVARQFGFGETTILRLCEKEGIQLEHLVTKAERTQVVEMLKTNLNALATAKQLGLNHKTVLAIAKKEGIDIKAMRQAVKGRETPRFTQWTRGPGGKRVLQCAVYATDGSTSQHKKLRDYSRLCHSLNTSDPDVAAQRMRLILWKAIADKRLPGGVKHLAWRLYGGGIPEKTKRLLSRLRALPRQKYELRRRAAAQRLGYQASTIDWLTNQDIARQADPVRQRLRRTLGRSRGRKVGQRTPISRSWQFGPIGQILAVHSDERFIYAQLTIAGFTLRWRLPVQNRAEAEALVKSAVEARARVREAAGYWRECRVGSPEAKAALTSVLSEQRRFRDALAAVGAERSKNWATAVPAFDKPPFDETTRRDLEKGCTAWFVEILLNNPDRPPPGRPVRILLKEADELFCVGGRGVRRCYEFAQEKTGNRNWSTSRRPRKSES